MVPVTAFFAGLLTLIYLALTVGVIRGRYTHKVSLGDGGHSDMNRRIRAHANFAEYVPLALVLMALCELSGTSGKLLAALGALLVFGRMCHAYSLTIHEVKRGRIIFRQIGTASTLTVLIVLSLAAMF
jgi:hypothetical protein